MHLNAEVERNYRGGIGNFGGEIESVLGFGGVEGCGAVGGAWFELVAGVDWQGGVFEYRSVDGVAE